MRITLFPWFKCKCQILSHSGQGPPKNQSIYGALLCLVNLGTKLSKILADHDEEGRGGAL